MAAGNSWFLNIKAKGAKKASKDVKKLKQNMGGLNSSVKKLAIGFGSLYVASKVFSGIKRLTGGITGLATSSISTAGQFETLRVRLDTMYGSVKRGGEAFENFNKIAAKTPFQLQDVVDAGATLKAFGIAAEANLSAVSDVAAFMQVDISVAAANMGRAFSAGSGAADMFRDKGINPLIASFAGVKDVSELTLPEFREAMIGTFSDTESGIAGMTDKMSQTWEGQVSNLKDGVDRIKNVLGKALISKLQPLIENVNGVFSEMGDIGWEHIGESMATNWKEILRFLGDAALIGGKIVGRLLIRGISIGLQLALQAVMHSLGDLNNAIVKLFGLQDKNAAKITKWLKQELDFTEGNKKIWKSFGEDLAALGFQFTETTDLITDDAKRLKEELLFKEFPSPMWGIPEPEEFSMLLKTIEKVNDKIIDSNAEVLEEKLKNAAKGASSASQGMKSAVKNEAMEAVAGLISGLFMNFHPVVATVLSAGAGGLVSGIIDKGLSQIPEFAQGGSFVTNGEQLIRVGDNPSGRELVNVTPLDAGGSPTSSAGGINVTFTGNVMSEEFITEQAIPQIKEAIRRGADIGVS